MNFEGLLKFLGINQGPQQFVSPLPPTASYPINDEESYLRWIDQQDLAQAEKSMAQANPPAVLGSMTINQEPQDYRNPQWDTWKKQSPKSFEELLSGATLANQKYPNVPVDLNMDVSGIEAASVYGKPGMKQMGGGPGRGYHQFELPLPKDLQAIADNEFGGAAFDPTHATQSAQLFARLANDKQLSRWGTPQGTWGSLDNVNRQPKDRVRSYYSPEELNPFMPNNYQF
jgi:hypothetical protein